MPPAEFRQTEEEFPGGDDEVAEDEDEDSSDDAADLVGSVISANLSNMSGDLIDQMSQMIYDEEESKMPNIKAKGRASI